MTQGEWVLVGISSIIVAILPMVIGVIFNIKNVFYYCIFGILCCYLAILGFVVVAMGTISFVYKMFSSVLGVDFDIKDAISIVMPILSLIATVTVAITGLIINNYLKSNKTEPLPIQSRLRKNRRRLNK